MVDARLAEVIVACIADTAVEVCIGKTLVTVVAEDLFESWCRLSWWLLHADAHLSSLGHGNKAVDELTALPEMTSRVCVGASLGLEDLRKWLRGIDLFGLSSRWGRE